jgi:hypothetical protein
MRPRLAALAFVVAVAACQRDGVVLTVRAPGMLVDELAITARYDGRSVTQRRPDPAASAPLDFPEDLFADFGGHSVDVVFTVDALYKGQLAARTVMPSLHVGTSQLLDAVVDLTAIPPPSMPPPPPPPRPNYASVVLGDAPLAYYRLDEPPSATVAHDASANKLDGTYGAQVVRGVPGLIAGDIDGAARFNGGNWTLDGIVTVPRSPQLEPTAALSIEIWLSPIANNPDFATLLDYGDSPSLTQEPPYGAIMFQNAIGTLFFTSAAGSVGDGAFVTVTHPAPQKTYHYVQTYDGVNMKLYVNGVLEAQRAVSGLVSGYGLAGLGIGGAPTSVSDLIFAGTLDEVAIYGVALSPTQVMAHYVAGTRP